MTDRTVRVKLEGITTQYQQSMERATASTYDAGLVGKVFRITDVPADGLQIARVVMLEEAVT